jgi:hypothetical protein
MQVVIEAPAMADEATIQSTLTSVPKRRMTDVMNKRERLGQVFIQAKRGGRSAGYLRYLDGMGQSAAKVIGGAAGEHLRLPGKPPEGTGLHDALTVTLKGRARGAERRRIDASQKKIVRIPGDCASMEIDCHSQI